MKNQTTGIILASGEGSRLRELSDSLNLPKHLFPIGETSIIGRIINDMVEVCDQIICIVPPENIEKFQKDIASTSCCVEVIAKSSPGFRGDFEAAFKATKHKHIILTVGDLVFPDGEVRKFSERVSQKPDCAFLAFDSSVLWSFKFPTFLHFRIVMASLSKDILNDILGLNPESFWSVATVFMKYFLKNRVRSTTLGTLFNINTPESYYQAKNYFDNE